MTMQPRSSSRIAVRAMRATVLSLLLALMLAGSATAAGRLVPPPVANPHSGEYHACGTIHVPQEHDWFSIVDGDPVLAGNHWIVAMQSKDGSCDFARHIALHLVTMPANHFVAIGKHPATAHSPARFPNLGQVNCSWETRSSNDLETVRPFHQANCLVVEPITKRHTAIMLLKVLVDPDPRYIFQT
jgi:hypothetical protein